MPRTQPRRKRLKKYSSGWRYIWFGLRASFKPGAEVSPAGGVYVMYCLVGLGNPGTEYQQTRHNAGFLVIDQLAQDNRIDLGRRQFKSMYGKGRLGDREVLLVKPETFMNLSGQAVSSWVNYFKIPLNQVLIIHDDLDLPLGTVRLKPSGSSGGHRGLSSIIELLGTSEIPRLRLGIGRPARGTTVVDYVLAGFSGAESKLFQQSTTRAAAAACSFVTEGLEYAMSRFNGKAGDSSVSDDSISD